MRTFLPDDPPEPPSVDQDCNSTHPTTSTDTSSSTAANAGSGQQAPDSTLAAGERLHSSRVAAGAAEIGNECSSGGNGSDSRNNGGVGGGRVRSPSSSNNNGGGGGGGGSSFTDEAAAGGAGLVLSSPRHLEPFLSPSSLSASPLIANPSSAEVKSVAEVTTVEATAGEIAGLGLANGSCAAVAASVPVGASSQGVGSATGMTPSKYPVGAGGGMGQDDPLWLVYEGGSAAGKGVLSKVNAPDPYWLGRAPPGAVCPHQHSMEFFSSFESSNLLRAVQVGRQDSSVALLKGFKYINKCYSTLFKPTFELLYRRLLLVTCCLRHFAVLVVWADNNNFACANNKG